MTKKDAFKKLKEIFFKKAESTLPVAVGTIISGILYGAEYLMEKEILCPCDLQLNVRHTVLAFCVPAVSLFLISLLVLPDARKVVTCRVSADSRSTCRCQSCQTCAENPFGTGMRKVYFFLYTLLKVLLPSILWIVILFADGDYYVCASLKEEYWKTNIQNCSASCASIPKLIPSELSKLCVDSQTIGGILLVLTLSVLVVLHFLPGCICSEEQQAKAGEDVEIELI
ncbi:calcium homeostasis modulator protein 6-like [Pristis pectinata]|uniref:calcium homeostasis modulator protein 6-like n=1 Tax=Pristis pectinata TaxID=685728 RepID=UPI00223CFE0D|nr:calcium homeostasis modulator protein 6-like [Pristis pectinata]